MTQNNALTAALDLLHHTVEAPDGAFAAQDGLPGRTQALVLLDAARAELAIHHARERAAAAATPIPQEEYDDWDQHFGR
jgi:hypothetical protein